MVGYRREWNGFVRGRLDPARFPGGAAPLAAGSNRIKRGPKFVLVVALLMSMGSGVALSRRRASGGLGDQLGGGGGEKFACLVGSVQQQLVCRVHG